MVHGLPSALSRLSLRVAALARVRNFHGLATVATPMFSLDNALACCKRAEFAMMKRGDGSPGGNLPCQLLHAHQLPKGGELDSTG